MFYSHRQLGREYSDKTLENACDKHYPAFHACVIIVLTL